MSKLKCEGLDKFVVIEKEDCLHYLMPLGLDCLDKLLEEIQCGRRTYGKKTDNEYIVINTDEPCINEIIEILKKNGHWGEGKTA